MLKPWVNVAIAVINISGLCVVIAKSRNKKTEFRKTLAFEKRNSYSSVAAYFMSFIKVFRTAIITILLTILISIPILKFGVDKPIISPPPSSTPSYSPTPTITITPTSTIYLGEPDAILSEIGPIIPKPEAFYKDIWNKYEEISVGNDPCPCSIGIRIPEENLREYYDDHSHQRILHQEFQEYSLGYQFDTLVFNYGIDDSTFAGNEPSVPSGMCRIVIQYVLSDGFLKASDNILFDSGWFNYHLTMRQGVVNLANVETIRITASWVFDVDPAKDNFMNLAIVDPYLYYKES